MLQNHPLKSLRVSYERSSLELSMSPRKAISVFWHLFSVPYPCSKSSYALANISLSSSMPCCSDFGSPESSYDRFEMWIIPIRDWPKRASLSSRQNCRIILSVFTSFGRQILAQISLTSPGWRDSAILAPVIWACWRQTFEILTLGYHASLDWF